MTGIPNYTELLPAYGRDYRRLADVRDAFANGKDFRVALTGQYLSVRDVPAGTTLLLRYADAKKVTTIVVTVAMLERTRGVAVTPPPAYIEPEGD